MSLMFPSPATSGEIFTSPDGIVWIYDGVKWKAATPSTSFLPLAGGTMTGPLILNGEPTQALGAATKQDMDARPGRNRVINGSMIIDQWNNFAPTVSSNGNFACDRWRINIINDSVITTVVGGAQTLSNAFGSAGNLLIVSNGNYSSAATDYNVINQLIETVNMSDFQWGGPNALPATLSFWVNVSVGGTYSGSLVNGDSTRSYTFSFTVLANVWTRIVITIPGDTGGNWVFDNNACGLFVTFDLGSGANFHTAAGAWTNGNYLGTPGSMSLIATNLARYNLTNVQLELGTQATPFAFRSYGEELALCQRYYEASSVSAGGSGVSGVPYTCSTNFSVTKRSTPTITGSGAGLNNAVPSTAQSFGITSVVFVYFLSANGNYSFGYTWQADAEL